MDADLDYRLWTGPLYVIPSIIEEEVVPLDEVGIITREDGTKCKIITVTKGGEKVEVCVPLRDDE